jgi:hypothetical protein
MPKMIERAEAALAAYDHPDADELSEREIVSDLITDLLHYLADRTEEGTENVLTNAETNFNAEQDGEE